MKNYGLLIEKIDQGIQYIEEQDKKLQPVIDYLVDKCLEHKEELSASQAFEFLIQFMQMKNECLLLNTKMREVLTYCDKTRFYG